MLNLSDKNPQEISVNERVKYYLGKAHGKKIKIKNCKLSKDVVNGELCLANYNLLKKLLERPENHPRFNTRLYRYAFLIKDVIKDLNPKFYSKYFFVWIADIGYDYYQKTKKPGLKGSPSDRLQNLGCIFNEWYSVHLQVLVSVVKLIFPLSQEKPGYRIPTCLLTTYRCLSPLFSRHLRWN